MLSTVLVALAWQALEAHANREPRAAEDSQKAVVTDWRDWLDPSERLQVALDAPLDVDRYEPSGELVAFFADATIESFKPFLGSEQLLQQAARYVNDPGIVAFLLESGFDPNRAFGQGIPAYPHGEGPDQREGPLHHAAKYNPNPSIVEALLQGGADVHADAGMLLELPLHYAAAHNNPAVVLALIENGAQIDAVNGPISPVWMRGPNINGNTALHSAAINDGNSGVIDALVDAGGQVKATNSSGLAPLHFAVLAESSASVSALLHRGADPNQTIALVEGEDQMHDCTGCNAIHVLVDSQIGSEAGNAENLADLLKLLVDGGGDVNARTEHPGMYAGYSPLHLAVEAELDASVVALLMELGAQVDDGALCAAFSETFQYSGRFAGAYDNRAVESENSRQVLNLLLESIRPTESALTPEEAQARCR